MENKELDLPREEYEPVVSRPMKLETELTLDIFDIYGPRALKTCYGDVCKIVNALRDYSKLLEMVCDTWDLQGFHRATYEYHAEKLREIAQKYQAGIGYDYDKAMEKCQKKREKKQRDDDVGGEALTMGFLKAQQAAEAKARKAAERKNGESPSLSTDAEADDPWGEDL